MTDDEFDSPDEWQQLADECTQLLTEAGIACTLHDEGRLDGLDLRGFTIFMDYRKIFPVYSISLSASKHAEIAICATRMSEVPFKFFNPVLFVNAPYFNEIKDSILLEVGDARLYGTVPLRDDPGDLLIEPVDVESRITELARPVRLAIDGFDSFRLRHHFQCFDPDAAEAVLTPDFFTLVDELGPVYIEVHNGLLIVGFKRVIDDTQPAALANFLLAFAEPNDSDPS
ncbi:MAG: hypothetical protein JSS75_04310 [Bacteroidetes bacterium]|nr:hypothetical protein [Bacteroidota bacterium]